MDVHPRECVAFGHITSCPVERPTKFARMPLAICLAILLVGSVCLAAKADVPMSEHVRVFFELEGKPLDQPVYFRVTCYGYRWDPGPDYPPTRVPGSYEPEIVYRFSGNCPQYGCKIAHSIYLNYLHIEYCDLLVEAEDQDYTLPKFASAPVDMSTCNGMECSLRVDLATAAVLPVTPETSSSASPSPAPTAPSRSATASTGTSPPLSETADSRTYGELFLIAWLLALLIEVPILFAMVRFVFRLREIGWLKLLITGGLATSLTLPCLWFIAPEVLGAPYVLIVGEILVFLVEAGIYALVLQIGIRRGLLISLVANLASFALGAVLL